MLRATAQWRCSLQPAESWRALAPGLLLVQRRWLRQALARVQRLAELQQVLARVLRPEELRRRPSRVQRPAELQEALALVLPAAELWQAR
jgi:hypothetical protein